MTDPILPSFHSHSLAAMLRRRRSSFVVRRSSFVVRRSSFLCRSSFVARRSSFVGFGVGVGDGKDRSVGFTLELRHVEPWHLLLSLLVLEVVWFYNLHRRLMRRKIGDANARTCLATCACRVSLFLRHRQGRAIFIIIFIVLFVSLDVPSDGCVGFTAVSFVFASLQEAFSTASLSSVFRNPQRHNAQVSVHHGRDGSRHHREALARNHVAECMRQFLARRALVPVLRGCADCQAVWPLVCCPSVPLWSFLRRYFGTRGRSTCPSHCVTAGHSRPFALCPLPMCTRHNCLTATIRLPFCVHVYMLVIFLEPAGGHAARRGSVAPHSQHVEDLHERGIPSAH